MKIDTTKIDGYEAMTAEEKIAALEAYEMATDYTGYVKKELLDKANSEAASYKKQLEEKMTDEERKAAEENALVEQLRQENEALKREKNVSEATAKYISMGFDENLAKETAEAQVNGEMDKVMANVKITMENVRKQAEKANLEKMEDPARGQSGAETLTKEKFRAMSLDQKQELATTQPELYKQMTSQN